ncbi:hypothetical protein H4R34_003738 [Dimargaris verticillata]|uniref:Dynamitin-domain-containing protein n=1 Tax=Dimargaris verticillata TaxID=2761393 RepID=A0A9W8E8S9_9FUNG|nr:hypothetical protein H4R34_003738 [Dimargaris verticillata]
MAASTSTKYANLPDIDTQPDVYETPDAGDSAGLAYAFTGPQDPESTNEAISTQEITPSQALDKFRTTTGEDVDAGNADNDDRRHALVASVKEHRKALYRNYLLNRLPNAGEYEFTRPEATLQETPVQRLRRLLFETQELAEELQSTGSKANGDDGSLASSHRRHSPPTSAELLTQVHNLQQELSQLSTQSSQSAPGIFKTRPGQDLVSHLAQLQGHTASTDSSASAGSTAATPRTTSALSPEMLGQLERRVAELEALLGQGASTSGLTATASASLPAPIDPGVGPQGVLATMRTLEAKISILAQPRHLESLSRRAKALTQEFDILAAARDKSQQAAIATAASGTTHTIGNAIDDEVLDKINHLFDLVGKIDPLVETTPALVTRLQSLQSLHREATLYTQTLRQCSTDQTRIDDEMNTLRDIATQLQGNIKDNTATIEANMASLDQRIETLAQRMANLPS